MTKPANLNDRYGRSDRKLRTSTKVLAGVLLASFLSFAVYASFIAEPAASVELASYEQVDANHIAGNYTAFTASKRASCVFKAYATRGNVVGFVEVEIPANHSDKKALQVVVKTLEPASVLRADGCTVK